MGIKNNVILNLMFSNWTTSKKKSTSHQKCKTSSLTTRTATTTPKRKKWKDSRPIWTRTTFSRGRTSTLSPNTRPTFSKSQATSILDRRHQTSEGKKLKHLSGCTFYIMQSSFLDNCHSRILCVFKVKRYCGELSGDWRERKLGQSIIDRVCCRRRRLQENLRRSRPFAIG